MSPLIVLTVNSDPTGHLDPQIGMQQGVVTMGVNRHPIPGLRREEWFSVRLMVARVEVVHVYANRRTVRRPNRDVT